MSLRAPATKEECYEVTKIYDFFDVIHWMAEKYQIQNFNKLHDLMFEMISHSDQEGRNDSLHRVYRHWLTKRDWAPSPVLQSLFDDICKVFDIPHDIPEWAKDEDHTCIVFWVSW